MTEPEDTSCESWVFVLNDLVAGSSLLKAASLSSVAGDGIRCETETAVQQKQKGVSDPYTKTRLSGDPSSSILPWVVHFLGRSFPSGIESLLTKKKRRFQFVSFFVTLKTG